MMNRKCLLAVAALIIAATFFIGCGGAGRYYSLPQKHPEALEKPSPDCTECHVEEDPAIDYSALTHRLNWVQTHRIRAYGYERICSMCHSQSFCGECHQTRVELKPSLRKQTEVQRVMIHRGDYLARHRIDGQINPASCIRCHSNPKSSKSCVPCHG